MAGAGTSAEGSGAIADPEVSEPGPAAAAARLALLGTLVAGLAHEINNPVSYVLGNLAELSRLTGALQEAQAAYRTALAGRGATPEELDAIEAGVRKLGGAGLLAELIDDATEGAVRIRDLVRDLLAINPTAERSQRLDPHELLDATLRLLGKRLDARAVLERDYRATRTLHGGRARLGQVFLNLIGNAIDACADAGEDRIAVRTRDEAGGVCIEIEDSGPGIPESVALRLFTPFFTTKAPGKGTGLGLYISRGIVREHGGTLEYQCSESGGTIFRVRLPERGPRAQEG